MNMQFAKSAQRTEAIHLSFRRVPEKDGSPRLADARLAMTTPL
jgi:hypothetical protein